ncbi:MAG: type II restriction endonuclease [Mariprofundaceae bacterium]|nr:type II restriction endonuclease [Mariprofundaceae bacterium]
MNAVLCSKAADVVLKGKSESKIKANFSALFDQMQDEIYQQYLKAENDSGQAVIDKLLAATGTIKFKDMNAFLMSIFQSRKSRAGKAFEYIIRELFSRLSYPFAEQVDVDGATPDFIMPSEKSFRENPLGSIIFTAKRTLRERWRQVVTEANKGYGFFLATLDNNITQNQINQAAKNKIYIVVPEKLKETNDIYRDAHSVLSFEQFFEQHLDPAVCRWDKEK